MHPTSSPTASTAAIRGGNQSRRRRRQATRESGSGTIVTVADDLVVGATAPSGGGVGKAFYADDDLESGVGTYEDRDRAGGYEQARGFDYGGGSGGAAGAPGSGSPTQRQPWHERGAPSPVSSPPGVELGGANAAVGRASSPMSSGIPRSRASTTHLPSAPDSDAYYVAPTREFLLSDYMVSDREYQEFLLYGKGRGRDAGSGINCGGVSGRDCARGCAGFSFVGMLFLIFAGLLIEWQPLYVKGIKYNAGFMSEASGGGGGNTNWRYRINSAGKQQYYQYKSKRPLRKESSNAFKAAAAYFLTMVLSLICVQNYEQMDLSIPPRWRRLLHVRQNCALAYHKYRRRQYVDIPDAVASAADSTTPTLPLFRDSVSADTTRRRRGHSQPQNATVELWNKVAHTVGSMRSPMRRRRDAKTKHV